MSKARRNREIRRVLAPRGLALAQNLGPWIDEHAIAFMSSVPSLWHIALRMSPKPRTGSLKRVHIGSAPLSAALWSRIAEWTGCEVVNCYGITETANWIGGASSREHVPADGLIGRPWGGTAAVRSADGSIRTHGTGEILVQTPSLMSGCLEENTLVDLAEGRLDGEARARAEEHLDFAKLVGEALQEKSEERTTTAKPKAKGGTISDKTPPAAGDHKEIYDGPLVSVVYERKANREKGQAVRAQTPEAHEPEQKDDEQG